MHIMLRIFLQSVQTRINTSVAVPMLFLKSAAFVSSGSADSLPVSGTNIHALFKAMLKK